jgi:hypothetical protein
MPLTVICVTGPASTGKSTIIREFTRRHLKYEREKGDVLGIFRMPRRGYAIGVSGSGDALSFIIKGQKFLTRYDGLRVMVIAARSEGKTLEEVQRFANKAKAHFVKVPTKKLASAANQAAAIRKNVRAIKQKLP